MRISKVGSLGLELGGISGVCRRWLKGCRLGRVGVGNGRIRMGGKGGMRFWGLGVWGWVCSLLSLRFGCITNDRGTGMG